MDSVAALKLQSGLVRHQSRGNSSDAEENAELEVAEIQMSSFSSGTTWVERISI